MPRTQKLTARAYFMGGPMARRKVPMRAAGRTCEYRDRAGIRLRQERGQALARPRGAGGVYVLTGHMPPVDAPAGSRVYRWVLPRNATTPRGTTP